MNERLRRSLAAAHITGEALAEAANVDPKTVQHWLKGRIPHARHRWKVAELLNVHEDILWPTERSDPENVDLDTVRRLLVQGTSELTTALDLLQKPQEASQTEVPKMTKEEERTGTGKELDLGSRSSEEAHGGIAEAMRNASADVETHNVELFSSPSTPIKDIVQGTPEGQDMEQSRREFLQMLSVLGTELLITPQIQEGFSDASVANLATITQQFRALQRRGVAFIINGVNTHIRTIQEALEYTVDDGIRCELWRVLAQSQIIAGFNPMKKAERGRAKTLLEAAIASAQNSGDALLTGAALGHLAHFSLREEQNIVKASQLLRRAQECVQASHPLHGWFALVMASIAAKAGHEQQCEGYLTDAMTVAHHLPQTPEYTDLYFTDFSLVSAHIFAVNCQLVIDNAAKAYTHLTEINLEELSDNRRASAFCDASTACAMVGEFAMAQHFAFQAIDKAHSTRQIYVIPRCVTLAQTIRQKVPDAPYAAAITDYARLALQQN